MTGLYGNGNDLTIFRYAGSGYETLAKISKLVATTLPLHGNTGAFYYRNYEHLKPLALIPIMIYSILKLWTIIYHSFILIADDYFFNYVPTLLEAQSTYFGYAITLTTHSPYVPADEIPTYDWGNLTDLATSYLNYCRYLDGALGLFIDLMEQKNLLDEVVLVLYTDHTSSLFKPVMIAYGSEYLQHCFST
jgi:phosphoglycerol transferase MdoB-like AlkP superfamily enzyme